jgi:hypothetical protein
VRQSARTFRPSWLVRWKPAGRHSQPRNTPCSEAARDFPASSYEQRYAAFFGKFRLPLISRAASAFRLCGDWSQGGQLHRLCASCAQKRTLLLGEYLSEDLLLCLPTDSSSGLFPRCFASSFAMIGSCLPTSAGCSLISSRATSPWPRAGASTPPWSRLIRPSGSSPHGTPIGTPSYLKAGSTAMTA